MNISIITSFYYGNKYIAQYVDMMNEVIHQYKSEENNIEVIMVNDSPEQSLIIPENCMFDHMILNNSTNCGIHQSRVNGLKITKYDYVIFLDQDDVLCKDTLTKYKLAVKDADLLIGNGIYEVGENNVKIFRTLRSLKYATKKYGYYYVRNLIVSPGHCLIKKEAIPREWIDNLLSTNGSDDYFLWILLFFYRKKIAYINEITYIHKDTGCNLSVEESNMITSTLEFLEYMLKSSNPKMVKLAKTVKRTVEFKYNYKTAGLLGRAKIVIPYYKLFLYNCIYHVWYKGI